MAAVIAACSTLLPDRLREKRREKKEARQAFTSSSITVDETKPVAKKRKDRLSRNKRHMALLDPASQHPPSDAPPSYEDAISQQAVSGTVLDSITEENGDWTDTMSNGHSMVMTSSSGNSGSSVGGSVGGTRSVGAPLDRETTIETRDMAVP